MRLGGAESPTGYVHPLNGDGRQARFSDITDVVVPASLGGATSTQSNLGLYPNESYVDFETANWLWTRVTETAWCWGTGRRCTSQKTVERVGNMV